MLKIKTDFTIYDIVIMLIILFQGSNHLKVFPSPFYKYIICLLFVLLVIKYIKEKKRLKINFVILVWVLLLYAFSIIVSLDKRLVVPMIFFIIEIYAFKMYINLFETKQELFERILKIILVSATILSVIGFIQIIGYKLNINFLHDYKWMGIIPNYYGYLAEGRYYSIYDEPAHLCTILGAGLFSSYYFMKKDRKYMIPMIIIAIFGFFTGSVITYVALLAFVLYILFYNLRIENEKLSKTKIIVFCLILVAIAILVAIKPSLIINSIEKINNFFSDNADSAYLQNGTTFALKSNYLIAINKIKDGYILGTGIFTHEFYYYSYIDRIYTSHYQQYLNYSDAASIFIRILSEFGVLSSLIYIAIIVYIYKACRKNNYMNLFYIMMFITQGMRLGDYTWFFNCLPIVIIFSDFKNDKLIILKNKIVNKVQAFLGGN